MNQRLIPSIGSAQAMEKYDLKKWRLYARNIQKNPYISQYLITKYSNICPWCSRNIYPTRLVIHHIDYDWECTYHKTKRIPYPTEKSPNRSRLVPDCENCHIERPINFHECIDRLAPVHRKCHLEIHKEGY